MTTMADLREFVRDRLRESIHGKEIDTLEKGMPEMPHMLGIVPVGAISTKEAEMGTILDCDHEFWDDYHETVNTKNKAKKQVRTAMMSLREDGIFRVTSPYGDDAGILYAEVDSGDNEFKLMDTECAKCHADIKVEPTLSMDYGLYRVMFYIDCSECDFDTVVGRELSPQQ